MSLFYIMDSTLTITLAILGIAAVGSIKAKKLTPLAAFTGWVIAAFIYKGTGYAGILMMAAFFVLSTIATLVGFKVKQSIGVAERDQGKRTAGQVFANAGVAGLIAIVICLDRSKLEPGMLMISAALASATADTLSSELGNVFGRSFYNIVSWKKDIRGLDGVISLEGTLIGLAGSAVIALIYSVSFGFSIYTILIVIAGTIGNLSDSYLGAALERKKLINNNTVNFLNTLIAAVIGLVLY